MVYIPGQREVQIRLEWGDQGSFPYFIDRGASRMIGQMLRIGDMKNERHSIPENHQFRHSQSTKT